MHLQLEAVHGVAGRALMRGAIWPELSLGEAANSAAGEPNERLLMTLEVLAMLSSSSGWRRV